MVKIQNQTVNAQDNETEITGIGADGNQRRRQEECAGSECLIRLNATFDEGLVMFEWATGASFIDYMRGLTDLLW